MIIYGFASKAAALRHLKAADVIDKGRPIRLTGGGGDPIRVDFVASPRLRGTLLPMRWTGA